MFDLIRLGFQPKDFTPQKIQTLISICRELWIKHKLDLRLGNFNFECPSPIDEDNKIIFNALQGYTNANRNQRAFLQPQNHNALTTFFSKAREAFSGISNPRLKQSCIIELETISAETDLTKQKEQIKTLENKVIDSANTRLYIDCEKLPETAEDVLALSKFIFEFEQLLKKELTPKAANEKKYIQLTSFIAIPKGYDINNSAQHVTPLLDYFASQHAQLQDKWQCPTLDLKAKVITLLCAIDDGKISMWSTIDYIDTIVENLKQSPTLTKDHVKELEELLVKTDLNVVEILAPLVYILGQPEIEQLKCSNEADRTLTRHVL